MHWIIIFLFFISLYFLYKAKSKPKVNITHKNTSDKVDKEKEFDQITDELNDWEENLETKENQLNEKEKRLRNREKSLAEREKKLNAQKEEVKKAAKKRREERLEDIHYFEHFDITKAAFDDAVKSLDYRIIKSFIRKLHKKAKEYHSEGRNGTKNDIQHQGKVQCIDSNKVYEFYFGPNNDGRAYYRRKKKQNGYLILKIGKKDNQKEDISWIEKTYNKKVLL